MKAGETCSEVLSGYRKASRQFIFVTERTKKLVAYANGVRMGVLQDEKGIWSFAYDGQWLSSADAFPLSPAFELRKRALYRRVVAAPSPVVFR
jgi:hypothetical protein